MSCGLPTWRTVVSLVAPTCSRFFCFVYAHWLHIYIGIRWEVQVPFRTASQLSLVGVALSFQPWLAVALMSGFLC